MTKRAFSGVDQNYNDTALPTSLWTILFLTRNLPVVVIPVQAGMTEERIKTGRVGYKCDAANKVTVAKRSSETFSDDLSINIKTYLFAFNLLYLAAGN